MKLQKYKGTTRSFLYATNGKEALSNWNEFREVKVAKLVFHSGFEVTCNNGYTVLSVRHCSTVWKAKNEFRKMYKQFIKEAA